MEIIGIGGRHLPHDAVKDSVDRYISKKYPDLESLMIELPPEFPLLRNIERFEIFEPNFFIDIADRYENRGVKVIYGDRGRKSIDNPRFYQIIERIKHYYNIRISSQRNKGMAEAIKEMKPEVVLVGSGHIGYLKEEFPNAFYTVFILNLEKPDLIGWLSSALEKRRIKKHKPDKLVSVSIPFIEYYKIIYNC